MKSHHCQRSNHPVASIDCCWPALVIVAISIPSLARLVQNSAIFPEHKHTRIGCSNWFPSISEKRATTHMTMTTNKYRWPAQSRRCYWVKCVRASEHARTCTLCLHRWIDKIDNLLLRPYGHTNTMLILLSHHTNQDHARILTVYLRLTSECGGLSIDISRVFFCLSAAAVAHFSQITSVGWASDVHAMAAGRQVCVVLIQYQTCFS